MSHGEERRLLQLQRRLTVGVLILLTAFLVFQLGAYFADILRILGISVLISYLFINVVDFLTRYLRVRAAAITVVYVILGVLTVFGAILVVPAIGYQISQLIQHIWNSFPDAIQFINRMLLPLESRFQAAQLQVRTNDILNSFVAGIPKPEPGVLLSRVSDVAMSTMTMTLYTISVFVVSFYFLLEGRHIVDSIIALFPSRYRAPLRVMTEDMDKSLQSFFRGQIVLGLLAGIVMLGVYLALGIQYALLLSVFLAAWEIVPVIGPPIGFIPTVVSVAIHGMNFPGNRLIQILVIIAIFQILQQIKDNVIAPRYIGNVIGLHPIIIFIAIMIGARLDGILGIIFALPVGCAVNVLLSHLPLKVEESHLRPEILQDLGEGTETLPAD